MAIAKWIGGWLGWITLGPVGGLLGFLIGSFFDSVSGVLPSQGQQFQSGSEAMQMEGNRNSFLLSMLLLSAYIIKADGKVMHSEMELVRQMLRQNFGDSAAKQGNDILLRIFDEGKRMGETAFRQNIRQTCEQVSRNVDYPGRLQLLNFLVMIAQADGRVDATETRALKEMAQWMGLSADEVDKMLHLEGDTLEDAYRVLGVSPSATDDEVKRAFRRLALEHHPDRVAKLGDDVRRAAEKKFQEINAAKERIYKARGL